MSSVSFRRPVGAIADFKELEYISSLHQTEKDIRLDGSIKGIDIVNFLSSRHGIIVSEDEVRQKIIQNFGSCGLGNERIDLIQLVAIILIPTLLTAASEESTILMGKSESEQKTCIKRHNDLSKCMPPAHLIARVFKIIMMDVTNSSNPQPLTIELISKILYFYGEKELASDTNILDEMLAVVANDSIDSDVKFDVDTFTRALTADVQLYDVRKKTKKATSYAGMVESSINSTSEALDLIYTAPCIDFSASTHKSTAAAALLLSFCVQTFFLLWFELFGSQGVLGIPYLLQRDYFCDSASVSFICVVSYEICLSLTLFFGVRMFWTFDCWAR